MAIPLGSCTMKLNAASELMPVTWDAMNPYPMVPESQAMGYEFIAKDVENWLSDITGLTLHSEPNAGSQGEYAGLLVILEYHRFQENPQRKVCLIPSSN